MRKILFIDTFEGELCVVHTYICVHTHAHVHVLCVDQRPGVFLLFPTSFCETESLSEPRANSVVIPPSLFHGKGRSNLRSHTPTAVSHLPTGPAPQLQGLQGGFKKERHGCLAHCNFFHALVSLFVLLTIPTDLEGKLLVSYLSPLS